MRPRTRIAHELPQRLRLVAPHLFRRRDLDVTALARHLEARPGIVAVRINAGARSLVVAYDGSEAVRDAMLQAIAGLSSTDLPRLPEVDEDHGRFGALLLTAAAAALSPFLPLPLRNTMGWLILSPTLAAGAVTLATRGLRVAVLDAVAIGATAARGEMAAALITQFLLHLGEHMEAATNRTSDDLLRHLLRPAPSRVWVERGGDLVQIEPADVACEDIVVVGPGDMVPVDGQVLSGTANVNEAAISGEFLPAAKEAGDRVLSGAVVEEGRLRVRAVAVGDNTTSARINRFLLESLSQRSTIQQTAERLANSRVKFTLGLGFLTWMLTRDASRLASVFLVDYSCALKLGTPVAIKSTMVRGARHGILIKGGHALERLAEADTIVFDKTGTLTAGHLAVTDVVSLAPKAWPERRLLALIASVEEHSTHPVADAVVSAARLRHLGHVSHDDVEFIVAHGLISEVEGGRVVVGSRHFLQEHEGIGFDRHQKTIDRLEAEGKNLLFAGVDGRLVGIVALRDRLRDEAMATLSALRAQGIRHLVILTGDRRLKAEALGEQLGVDEVFAEQPPERKAEIVRELQARGRKVVFVGDGVNDAPALIAADVGIAMPQGADLARATADIVLLEDRLDAVAEAHALSCNAMALIRSNFRIAVGVNSLLFLAASLGVTRPILTALLHNGTTIGVLLRGLAGASSGRERPAALPMTRPQPLVAEQPMET